MSEENTTRSIYRLPPCPTYDVEGLESWLSDLAKEGLLLKKEGFFAGVAAFEKNTPRLVRYRLEAAPKSTSMWSDNWGDPDTEAVELNAEYGWEYVDKFGDFYIYRSFDPHARELNTDPEIQALTLKAVEKRLRGAFISTVLWMLIYPLLVFRGNLLLISIRMETWLFLLIALLFFYALATSLAQIIHLSRLRKRLLASGSIERKKDWRKRAKRHHIERAVFLFYLILVICFTLRSWSMEITDANEIPISEYTGTPPFSTLVDLGPDTEGDYKQTVLGIANTVREWDDLLAPVNIRWAEIAEIHYPDGTELNGSLYVDYHEAIHPAIAAELAKEYHREDQDGKYYEARETPELDVDYAAFYRDGVGIPTLVLQKDKKVLHISYFQHSDTHENRKLSLEEWAAHFADDLQ